MKHKHHIVPRHMGGLDEEENIIELTIEEHAEAHKKLYEEHGRKEDYLAWQGLSGMMNKNEIIKELLSAAGKKGGSCRSKENKIKTAKIGARANWEKNKDKILEVLKKNSENNKKLKEETGVGVGGPPKNKWIWVNNGNINKKIEKTGDIQEGWVKGRLKTWKTGISKLPKEKVTCPVCGKEGGKPVMIRYHFNNCKGNKNDLSIK